MQPKYSRYCYVCGLGLPPSPTQGFTIRGTKKDPYIHQASYCEACSTRPEYQVLSTKDEALALLVTERLTNSL